MRRRLVLKCSYPSARSSLSCQLRSGEIILDSETLMVARAATTMQITMVTILVTMLALPML